MTFHKTIITICSEKRSNEYLLNLQTRYKWKFTSKDIKLNDIVIVKDERLLPSKWYSGNVVEKHPEPNGITPVSYTHLDVYKRQIYKSIAVTEPL